MGKRAQIPHRTIVDYILSGRTTREAKARFGFLSDNVANLRVYTAFKNLRIKRPRYQVSRHCEFCGSEFIARDFKQRTCGSQKCQQQLIVSWAKQNPDVVRDTLRKYRQTEKGRQNNLRKHSILRARGLDGLPEERWHFAAHEIKKSIRKLKYLSTRHPWESRIQSIQQTAMMPREFNPRRFRRLDRATTSKESQDPQLRWQAGLRAVQTTLLQYSSRIGWSAWEKAVSKIGQAVRTGHRMRIWKRSSP